MIGAIIGDIVGSRFELDFDEDNFKSKDFKLFTKRSFFTDDSVLSIAICDALMRSKADHSDLSEQAAASMRSIGKEYPRCGYGGMFWEWLYSSNPKPYYSFGNGAAMRVSACGYVGNSIDEVKALSKSVTEVTHNHPEGIKGAEAVAVAIFLARTGKSMDEIRAHIVNNYYPLDFTIDDIRETYEFSSTCQGSIPQSLEAFLEATDFEDAIRNAVSLGGDTDTMAAIAGSVAEAYYGVPDEIRKRAVGFLDNRLKRVLDEFERLYPPKTEDTDKS